MTQPSEISLARVRLSKVGMGEEDVSWLEARRWSHAAIPPVMWPCDTHVYRRRRALLNKAIADLSVKERSASLEAKLAEAIGTRLANWGE
jgi:hypothetical protein